MYHSVFSVGRNFDTGDFYLDCYTTYSDEAEKIIEYSTILKNPLWKVTEEEAKNIIDCDDTGPANSVWAINIRCRFNPDMRIGHIITEHEMSRKEFEMYLKGLKYDKKSLKNFISCLRR